MQPKSTSKVLRLRAWQCFGKHVSSHVLSWAVLEAEIAIPNDIANKMVTDIDVFRVSMELVIFHEGNGGLVIAIEGCRTVKRAEDFTKERAQCHDRDLLQPSSTHSRAHKLNPENLTVIPDSEHPFPTQNTCSRPRSITPDPIGFNPIACTYLSLALVSCLSLPLIRYPYLSLVPSV